MRPVRPRLRRLAAALASLGALLAWGCSVNRDQCKQDGDCVPILGVASAELASCTEGVCRPRDTSRPVALEAPCDSTKDCTADGGAPALCRSGNQARRSCVSLLQGGISEVTPNYAIGDPLFIGVIASETVVTPNGTYDSFVDKTNDDGMRLAADDWLAATSGAISAANERRPITALYCDSQASADRLNECFDAMTVTLGAPVVVLHSDADAMALLPKAIARDVLLYCSDCELANFRTVDTGGRLWFGFPSVVSTIPLRVKWIETLEATIRSEQARPTDPLKALVVTSIVQPKTGAQLAEAIRLNGKSVAENVAAGTIVHKVLDRGFAGNFQALAQAAIDMRADIVVVENLGRDFHLLLMPEIEANWPNGVPRPRYVPGGDEGYPSRFQRSVASNDELRRRVTGVSYWTNDKNIDQNEIAYLQAFRSSTKFGYDPSGLSSGFESFYVLAYALTSAVHIDTVDPHAVRGGDVIKGLKSLIAAPGSTLIDVRASDIPRGVAALSTKQRIDLRGVISSLDWTDTGDLYTDAAGYCIKRDFNLKEFWIYDNTTKTTLGAPDFSGCQY